MHCIPTLYTLNWRTLVKEMERASRSNGSPILPSMLSVVLRLFIVTLIITGILASGFIFNGNRANSLKAQSFSSSSETNQQHSKDIMTSVVQSSISSQFSKISVFENSSKSTFMSLPRGLSSVITSNVALLDKLKEVSLLGYDLFSSKLVMSGLTLPSSIAFDNNGTMYVAEAGSIDGISVGTARIVKIIFTDPRHTSHLDNSPQQSNVLQENVDIGNPNTNA